MEKVVSELIEALGSDAVLVGDELMEMSSSFWDISPLQAKAYVRPCSVEEVSKVLAICHLYGQPVVTHGGTTGMVSGAHSTKNDVVLSLSRMNTIEDIDLQTGTLTVQSGVILQQVQDAAKDAGQYFPVDFGARGSCTIGGNISTNAGGNQVIRYGMMRNQVLGLEAVLADGTIISSMVDYLKDNTGYDLKQLFIGSEGTLGVVTRSVLRLAPLQNSSQTALLACGTVSCAIKLLQFLKDKLGASLSAFELIENKYYALNTGEFANRKPPMDNTYAYYVLVETLGIDQQRDHDVFEQAITSAYEAKWVVDAVIAQSESQRNELWEIRDDVEPEFHKHESVICYDISVSLKHMEAYCSKVTKQFNVTFPEGELYIFGHLGDGNLHLLSCDVPEAQRAVATQIILQPLKVNGGSISAEHGIGLEKKSYLGISRSEAEIAMMRTLKAALDPKGILNPGKIF